MAGAELQNLSQGKGCQGQRPKDGMQGGERRNPDLTFQILWFMTECPTRFKKFEDPKGLRGVFLQEKLQEE